MWILRFVHDTGLKKLVDIFHSSFFLRVVVMIVNLFGPASVTLLGAHARCDLTQMM